MTQKLTGAEVNEAFLVVAKERLRMGLFRKVRDRDHSLAVRQARKRYIAEGGDPGDKQAFIDWLKEHWVQILTLLLSLFA